MVTHYLIEGRVQGVGYRWFVQREAARLALRGWVRNTEEGAVEIVASGPENLLAELKSALDAGPRGSRVDRVHVHQLDDAEDGSLGPFTIEGAW
jgi:acylphosphatase